MCSRELQRKLQQRTPAWQPRRSIAWLATRAKNTPRAMPLQTSPNSRSFGNLKLAGPSLGERARRQGGWLGPFLAMCVLLDETIRKIASRWRWVHTERAIGEYRPHVCQFKAQNRPTCLVQHCLQLVASKAVVPGESLLPTPAKKDHTL